MSDATGIPLPVIEPKRRSRLADFFIRLVKEKPLGTVSGIIVLILIFVAIFASVLAPYPYYEVHPIDRLQGSSAQYLLGNDQLGRDLLSRPVMWPQRKLRRKVQGAGRPSGAQRIGVGHHLVASYPDPGAPAPAGKGRGGGLGSPGAAAQHWPPGGGRQTRFGCGRGGCVVAFVKTASGHYQ